MALMAHGTRTRRLKLRIMLVEDDMLLAQSLTDRLEGQGFHVNEADRGEDALELSDIYEYQVMILDLGLPDMSGDEVLDNLRAKNERLPVLVLSGEADVEARLSCLRAGADDYLTKPLNMDKIGACDNQQGHDTPRFRSARTAIYASAMPNGAGCRCADYAAL